VEHIIEIGERAGNRRQGPKSRSLAAADLGGKRAPLDPNEHGQVVGTIGRNVNGHRQSDVIARLY
jgi:hypothetical protein